MTLLLFLKQNCITTLYARKGQTFTGCMGPPILQPPPSPVPFSDIVQDVSCLGSVVRKLILSAEIIYILHYYRGI